MKKHFKKLRALTLIANTVAPLLVFLAFFIYAMDHLLLALIPFVVSVVIMMAFPVEISVDAPRRKREWNYEIWFRMAVAWLVAFWFLNLPGASEVVTRVISSEFLLDWKIILAVFLNCLLKSILNYRTAIELQDTDILAIYDNSSRNLLIQETEQDAALKKQE